MDGTLADSVGCLRSTFFAFSDYYNLDLTEADFVGFNGPKIVEVVLRIQREKAPQLDPQIMSEKYFEILRSQYLLAPPMPGSNALIEKAKALNVKLGIVTSNTRELASSWLNKYRFWDFMDFVVTGDDVILSKPNPEPYELAIELSGTKRACILAIEDSIQGAHSALEAGLTTYLVGTNQPKFTNTNLLKVDNLTMLYEILQADWKLDLEG